MLDATLKQLRSLAAVTRHGSVAEAGRKLHISPQAIGQQVRLLERAVGMDLMVRTPQGLRPTDAGTRVLRAARNVELELESCAQVIDQLRSGKVGRVALGAVSTAKYFAPRAIAGFRRVHPDVDVTLRIGNREEIVGALGALEVDLCITGRPPSTMPLDPHVIGPNPHVVIASPEHPLARREAIPFADLGDEVFLMRERGSGTRRLTETLFAQAGRRPTIGMEITSNETIKQAVIAGLGISLLSAHTLAAEAADGRLVVLDVEGTPVVRQWFVVRHKHGQLAPAGSALRDFLIEHCEDHLPG